MFETDAERTYVAQAGLIGSGLPNHRTVYTATDDNYQLAAGQEQVEVRLVAPAGRWRAGHQGLSIPARKLSDRRQLRGRERECRSDTALRLFPVGARRQAAGRRFGDGCRRSRASRSTPTRRSSRNSRLRTSRKARRSYPKNSERRLDRHAAALFLQRLAAAATACRASFIRGAWKTDSTRPA